MNTAEIERDKYERMWAIKDYRNWSPGESCAERAVEALGMLHGESVTDFGCGTGRAIPIFKNFGLTVHAIDHAENCLDAGIVVPFEVACLWNMPPGLPTDYGFCADVMEHIPTDHVSAVLAGIAKRVTQAVYFKISTVPDSCGKLIGETLHMTVQPLEWWIARVTDYFHVISYAEPAFGELEIIAVKP